VSDRYIVKREWARWIAAGDWNVYGTLTFALKSKPSMAEAERRWSLFWNKVDRACFGKSRSQVRVSRMVFSHQGSNRDNPHIHFLTKAVGDVQEFCVLLNAIWTGLDGAGAAIADQNEILPVISKRHAAWYMLHEDYAGEMLGFSETLTALDQPEARLRDNALTKLTSMADRFQHITDAERAYDKHLALAAERYNRRNR
jgi:hypothetical protein